MLFDRVSQIANDPRGAERRFIDTIPYRQPGT
jgi:hypothetical protein